MTTIQALVIRDKATNDIIDAIWIDDCNTTVQTRIDWEYFECKAYHIISNFFNSDKFDAKIINVEIA